MDEGKFFFHDTNSYHGHEAANSFSVVKTY